MSESSPTPPELMAEPLPPDAATVEVLRQTRQTEADKYHQASLWRTVHSMGNPRLTVAELSNNLQSDIGVLRYADMLSLEALGQDPATVVEGLGTDEKPLFTAVLADQTITATGYGQDGMTLRLDADSLDFTAKSDLVRERVADRIRQSPGHAALHKLESSRAELGVHEPSSLQTEYFNPNKDKFGTLSLLQSAGMIPDHYRIDRDALRPEYVPLDVVDGYFAGVLGASYKSRQEDETTIRYSTQQQDKWVTLIVDKQTGRAAFAFEPDEDYYYAERANQAAYEKSVPFIETKAGEELLGLLDGAGLMLHPNVQAELVRPGEADRYGSAYTQMSREIAKWVNRDARRDIINLFVPFDAAMRPTGNSGTWQKFDELRWQYEQSRYDMTDEQLQAEQAFVKEQLLGLDAHALSEPTKVLVGLAQGALKRDAVAGALKELPVTTSDVEITNGACFDVAAYYLGAAEKFRDSSRGLEHVTASDVAMLEKTHGRHTFMLQERAILNGVALPKGTLMQQGADGGWAMLRLTPFCFDSPEDQLATGSELAKAYANETQAITSIGGVSLAHIVAASAPTLHRSRGFFGLR